MTASLTPDQPVDPDHEYTVSVTRISLRRLRGGFGFLRALGPVTRQLATAEGLVTHSLRAELHRLRFSTYAVFGSRADAAAFVRSGVHGDVMRRLRGRVGPSETAIVQVRGADLPRTWDDAGVLRRRPVS